ncbi:MAG: V-type ATPase 116kDa subunit family protein [Candidatus Bathyarchaeota archaeon]
MLYPVRMVRVEAVVPADKVEEVIRKLGECGVAHFIDVVKTKDYKYKEVAKEVKRLQRENYLLQLSNRINNLLRRLGEPPYPKPVVVKDSSKVLAEAEKEVEKLEAEYMKIENEMKLLSEEKASLERDMRQVFSEYKSLEKYLSEKKIDVDTVLAVKVPEILKVREILRNIHEDLIEVQKNLVFIDVAGKLALTYEAISNEKDKLEKVKVEVEDTLKANEEVKKNIPKALSEALKVEEVLYEVKNVVEKKLEAWRKIDELKVFLKQLKSKLDDAEKSLTSDIIPLIGEDVFKVFEEFRSIFNVAEKLSLGSAEIENVTKKASLTASLLKDKIDILNNTERFILLYSVVRLVEEIRKEKVVDVEKLAEESKRLISILPAKQLEIVKRAFDVVAMERKIEELARKPEELKEKISSLAGTADFLHVFNEIVDIELKIEDLYKKFRQTRRTYVFEFWVDKSNVEKAVSIVKSECPSAIVNVGGEEKGDKPPTLMKNHPIAKPWEKLVAAYGLPNYHEIDPTIITVLTFPVIFGLMFGDMGHGLILLVGGLLIPKIWSKLNLKGELWDYIYKGRNLIVLCGITSIVFGFLYGEFFGPTNYHYALHHAVPTWYSDLTGLDKAPWFSPMADLMLFFKVAISVAIFHIPFGIILDLVNKLKAGEKREALVPISWLWFYFSFATLLILIMTPAYGITDVIFNPTLLGLFFITPFVGMLLLHKFAVGGFFEAFSETITKAIESLSNTFSYSRILALGLTHAIFSDIALLGAGNPVLFWVTFLMVTIFMIIALEGIITFAHSLRLHWVEWFSKFYSGDGVAFEGFTIKRRFTVAG